MASRTSINPGQTSSTSRSPLDARQSTPRRTPDGKGIAIGTRPAIRSAMSPPGPPTPGRRLEIADDQIVIEITQISDSSPKNAAPCGSLLEASALNPQSFLETAGQEAEEGTSDEDDFVRTPSPSDDTPPPDADSASSAAHADRGRTDRTDASETGGSSESGSGEGSSSSPLLGMPDRKTTSASRGRAASTERYGKTASTERYEKNVSRKASSASRGRAASTERYGKAVSPMRRSPDGASNSETDTAVSHSYDDPLAPTPGIQASIAARLTPPAPQAPPPVAGPGRCARAWNTFKASIAGGMGGAAGFGSKSIVEATVTMAAMGAGADAGTAATIALVAGGIYVGLTHAEFSSRASAWGNWLLGVEGYKPTQPPATEYEKQKEEFATLVGPVFLAFCAAYGVRGDVAQSASEAFIVGLEKATATTAGGVLTNLIVDWYKADRPDEYIRTPPPEKWKDARAAVRATMDEAWDTSWRAHFHKVAGRITGGLSGNFGASYFASLAAKPITTWFADVGAPALVAPALNGVLGMTIFLTCWFGFMQAGAALGGALDACSADDRARQASAPPTPLETVAVGGTDEGENDAESASSSFVNTSLSKSRAPQVHAKQPEPSPQRRDDDDDDGGPDWNTIPPRPSPRLGQSHSANSDYIARLTDALKQNQVTADPKSVEAAVAWISRGNDVNTGIEIIARGAHGPEKSQEIDIKAAIADALQTFQIPPSAHRDDSDS